MLNPLKFPDDSWSTGPAVRLIKSLKADAAFFVYNNGAKRCIGKIVVHSKIFYNFLYVY